MKDLSVGKEGKLILNFATPMLLGNIFQQMYNVVDSIIVGNYLGKEALAAVETAKKVKALAQADKGKRIVAAEASKAERIQAAEADKHRINSNNIVHVI